MKSGPSLRDIFDMKRTNSNKTLERVASSLPCLSSVVRNCLPHSSPIVMCIHSIAMNKSTLTKLAGLLRNNAYRRPYNADIVSFCRKALMHHSPHQRTLLRQNPEDNSRTALLHIILVERMSWRQHEKQHHAFRRLRRCQKISFA